MSIKTNKAPLAIILSCVPVIASGQDVCGQVYVQAIRDLAAQYSSLTDDHDRYRFARCQFEESEESTIDHGGSGRLNVLDMVDFGTSDSGGGMSTRLSKSDCEAIRQRSDYFNVTRTVTPPSVEQMMELRKVYETCVASRISNKPFCQVIVDSPRVEVRLIYATRHGESEPVIERATALLVDPANPSSIEDRELFQPGRVIADKVPLSSSITVGSARRVNFDVATNKGPVECSSVLVNQSVAVYGRVVPRLNLVSKSRARYSHNVFHNQCIGVNTGGQRRLRGCVPGDAKVVGHEFVDVPSKKMDWKIVPGTTSFKLESDTSQNCFIARASVWEPEISPFDLKKAPDCRNHKRNGTDYYVDVDYTQTSMVLGQVIDVAQADVKFPFEIVIPDALANSSIESVEFHLVVVGERGRPITLSTEAPRSGAYSALVPDGRAMLVINKGQ